MAIVSSTWWPLVAAIQSLSFLRSSDTLSPSSVTCLCRRVVVRVLEQDDVRFASRFADARHVDRWTILHGAHLLAGSASDAQRRVHVRPLQVHALHFG